MYCTEHGKLEITTLSSRTAEGVVSKLSIVAFGKLTAVWLDYKTTVWP